MPVYAVAEGYEPGIYHRWEDCEPQVSGYSRAVFRRFRTKRQAIEFLRAYRFGTRSLETYCIGKMRFSAEQDLVVVWTDGACKNNGRPHAKAGLGVWFGDGHPLNVSAAVKGRQTNNTAEIQAARAAIDQAASVGIGKLKIHTDSAFLVKAITKWIYRWMWNGWKLFDGSTVKNIGEFIKLRKAARQLELVEWVVVRGHSHIYGNEMADTLARRGVHKDQYY